MSARWCVEYFPHYVQAGVGRGWASTGCYRSRREARKRAQGLLRRGRRKLVRIVSA
jgi:hypothetical protein